MENNLAALNNTSNLKKNSNNLFNTLSFYSPIIITLGILVFSILSGAVLKFLFYIAALLFFTMIRIGIIYFRRKQMGLPLSNPNPDGICNMGNYLPFENNTYSIFVLCFTFMYFTFPMFVTSNINFQILIFFIIYIVFDIFTKFKNKCISGSNINGLVGDLVGGLLIGSGFTALVFYFAKNVLFINEVPSNKETCSMPSKQTFKCAVYKNGELINSTHVS